MSSHRTMVPSGPDLTPFEACAHCGDPFETDVSYPVLAREVDGDLELHSFCDEDCQAAWRARY